MCVFKNKNIVIAGATGGIGSATAYELCRYGAKLVLLDFNKERLELLCQQLDGEGHNFYVCDFNHIDEIESVIDHIVKERGPVDGFVHCAGTGEVRPLKMSKYPYMVSVMNVNFFSFVEIARCLTKRKAFNPGMSIVGVSSIGAFYGAPTKVAYTSSKAAMNAAVKCMAVELGGKGVRVNAIAPGATNTSMRRQYESYAQDTDSYKINQIRQFLGLCEPEDIANSIAFLLSDKSRMITGTCLTVDGGKMAT